MWVITGDKQDTAINIGYSSKLLTTDMDILKINATNDAECRHLLQSYVHRYIKEVC